MTGPGATQPIATKDRARGCMAGLALGDALGRPVEGMSARQIQETHGGVKGFVLEEPAGSDDTEYAIVTARAALRHGRALTAADVANIWLEDICHQVDGFTGGGFSEMAAIENLRRGLRPPQCGDHVHAWSDGLAMRVAPLGILAAGDPAAAARLAAEDGAVSHAGEGIVAGQAVAAAVAAAMGGADTDEAFDAAVRAVPQDSWTGRNLAAAREVVRTGDDPAEIAALLHDRLAVTTYFWADLAPEAVALALASVLFGGGDFRESVLFAVNLGRDADTNAAICGAIVGAAAGAGGLPADWLARVGPVAGSCLHATRGAHPLEVADELAALADAGGRP